jgi:glycosyltransferase involved in cell wall biosynthesis
MISIVLRSKNEEKWIGRCLDSIKGQKMKDIDIILVDNNSDDRTVEIAESHKVNIIEISDEEFTYGRALNVGINEAVYDTVALLSAHCVPVNELWADYLSSHFQSTGASKLCGVYGRQEPLPETSSMDKRDLWTTFRDERVLQSKDYFFHNANSAIRKSLWQEVPFDEEIRGVEDRDWGKRMINAGYSIIYEPNASVYHHHGIHQGRNERRASRVAEVIEYIRESGGSNV